MSRKRDAETISAERLLKALNCDGVKISIKTCLTFTRLRQKEAYFVVSIAGRGPIIGVSLISTGTRTELQVYRDVRKEITDYWNIETNEKARKPANSQFDLAFIHTAPVDNRENHKGRIMLPSREDLELLKSMRHWVKQDHQVDTFPLCIEIRPYRDRTRAFIVQENGSHTVRSIAACRRAIGQAAKRHRQPVIKMMAHYGFDLIYVELSRNLFKLNIETLKPFEYEIGRYMGK